MRISSFSGQKFAVAEINNKQAEIARLQAQISSGKQLQRPSDAPAKVAETENLDA
ncbi:MAG TPA: flagellar hook-associated protein 3, partial [Gammaproteobacteria bacterium]|nr:flagellar hook-associated protein 3 [Gammaproteobacteria bacterium]